MFLHIFPGEPVAQYRLPLSMADSSDAIARWALRAAAPAVQRVTAVPAVGDVPQLLLRAKTLGDMVPAFESLAEERKMDFEDGPFVKQEQKTEEKGTEVPSWLDKKDAKDYRKALGLALGSVEEQRSLAFVLNRNTITGMIRQKNPDDLAEYIGLSDFAGFIAYWIPEASGSSPSATSSIRHPGQTEVNFTWTHLTADSLDEEGERFEDFVKENSLPAVILVKEPKKTMKMLEGHQDAMLLWLVLNSAEAEAPCEETCSAGASGASGASATPQQALEDALKPWRQLLQDFPWQRLVTSFNLFTVIGYNQKLFILAIDIHQFPSFVEHELYAWDSPALVAQRFRHGPRRDSGTWRHGSWPWLLEAKMGKLQT
eukprot:s1305_g13.t1